MTIEERMNATRIHNLFFTMNVSTSEGAYTMPNTPTPTPSKKRRVMDYLASGRTLTANQAQSRFGVGNMRATMSNIKGQVEQYGNWEVVTNPSPSGITTYGMEFLGYTDNPFAIRAGIV